jgi:hypothetical protein
MEAVGLEVDTEVALDDDAGPASTNGGEVDAGEMDIDLGDESKCDVL